MKRKKTLKNKRIIIIAGIAIAIFLIVTGTKFYLYLNLLLGNDLIIKLSSNKENLFLMHGQSEKVNFKAYAITNPFCTSECSSRFLDISKGESIDEDNFSLKTPNFAAKEFVISSDIPGKGQKIYRFDIECRSIKTLLCNTNEEFKTRSIMITLDYDLNEEEKKIKNESRHEIESIINESENLLSHLNDLYFIHNEINKTLIVGLNEDISDNYHNIRGINNSGYELKKMWEGEGYLFLSEKINETKDELKAYRNKFNEINTMMNYYILSYNELIDNFTEIRHSLEMFNTINVTSASREAINESIENFNYALYSLSERDYAESIRAKINILYNELNRIKNLVDNSLESEKIYILNETISRISPNKVYSLNNYSFNVSFKEHDAVCCLHGECKKCCDDSCSDDEDRFPIIFLHGHIFNKRISAEYSLNSLSSLQKKFDEDGYLSAGSMFFDINENNKGVLGRTTAPITMKASYYFDMISSEGEKTLIQTKEDNIDTYAIRLKNIVDNAMYLTNRDKVIIVAHSMGGLVARRYIQIFGEGNVNKLVLIGTPNKGIDGNILDACLFFGTKDECNDMDKNSIFMNKINNNYNIGIKTYNIIGIGCDMDGKDGDGIVKKDDAYLEGAENYYIEGTCTTLMTLHSSMLNADRYPEVYETIRNSI